MAVVHFLHVDPGACSVIEHDSGNITMIDICNGNQCPPQGRGTFPPDTDLCVVNPIQYLRDMCVNDIFRFVLTHPDMDHMDGINELFGKFDVTNFWDTDNTREKPDFGNSRYNETDWDRYESLRDGNSTKFPKRLSLYSGMQGPYYNMKDENGVEPDGLEILSPTYKLINLANESDEYDDASYVILFQIEERKILFCGDSNNATWKHVMKKHEGMIANIDLMIAPHHGRDSNRDYKFLECTEPKLTLFGCAPKKYQAKRKWTSNGHDVLSTSEAGSVIVEVINSKMDVYITSEKEAISRNGSDGYCPRLKACFYCSIDGS